MSLLKEIEELSGLTGISVSNLSKRQEERIDELNDSIGDGLLRNASNLNSNELRYAILSSL